MMKHNTKPPASAGDKVSAPTKKRSTSYSPWQPRAIQTLKDADLHIDAIRSWLTTALQTLSQKTLLVSCKHKVGTRYTHFVPQHFFSCRLPKGRAGGAGRSSKEPAPGLELPGLAPGKTKPKPTPSTPNPVSPSWPSPKPRGDKVNPQSN